MMVVIIMIMIYNEYAGSCNLLNGFDWLDYSYHDDYCFLAVDPT